MGKPPVRLCCGERHPYSLCPNNKVMCCLCFFLCDVDELSTNEKDDPIDVCKSCRETELTEIAKRKGII